MFIMDYPTFILWSLIDGHFPVQIFSPPFCSRYLCRWNFEIVSNFVEHRLFPGNTAWYIQFNDSETALITIEKCLYKNYKDKYELCRSVE